MLTDRDSVKKAFDDIWKHHPEYQNWSSSSWWFFLLMPKQKKGYGPKQMMFTYASRQGKLIKVNNTWQKGFSPHRELYKNEEKFWTTVVGWINDGENVHEEIVHQPVRATLNTKKQFLDGMVSKENGEKHGAYISASVEHDLGIDALFKGENGYADFKIWGDEEYKDGKLVNRFELPEIQFIKSPAEGKLGNTQLVAWRKFQFKGEFKSPSGTEELEGVGYFQRVLMNIPMPPWKWVYSIFEDGSIFSAFMIYAGLHNFRRDHFLYKDSNERRVFHFNPTAYFYDANTNETILFDTATVIPKSNGSDHPDFYFKVSNKKGDQLKLFAKTHNHAQFLLDRRIFKYMWQTKFIYNEYQYEVTKMIGRINGNMIDKSTHGRLWGNIEYVWGWSL